MGRLFTSLLFLAVTSATLAEYKDVPPNKALMEFGLGTRHSLKQESDLKEIRESSKWTIPGGGRADFWVYLLKLGMSYTKEGAKTPLLKVINWYDSGAEVGSSGGPINNRWGWADWQRFHSGQYRCVCIRQYRWDDDSNAAKHLGPTVVYGFYCLPGSGELSHEEIELVFLNLQLAGARPRVLSTEDKDPPFSYPEDLEKAD